MKKYKNLHSSIWPVGVAKNGCNNQTKPRSNNQKKVFTNRKVTQSNDPSSYEQNLILSSLTARFHRGSVGQSDSSRNPPGCVSCLCPRHFTLQRRSPPRSPPLWLSCISMVYERRRGRGNEGLGRRGAERGGLASALRPGQQLESIKSVGLLLHWVVINRSQTLSPAWKGPAG